ncbi:MAG: T9SS type A sorting domain-containing protein, partial [Bacteroidales bacterium]|nr:T9SS type A sorting domain-containing protein [Bacteroidales bacterium]
TPFLVSGAQSINVSVTALARKGNNNYHCRVFVINQNGTYYAQSNHFVSVINYSENLYLERKFTNDPTIGYVYIQNNRTEAVSVSIGYDINNHVTINPQNSHNFAGLKGSYQSIYINYSNPENTAVYQKLVCKIFVPNIDLNTQPDPRDKLCFTLYGIYGSDNGNYNGSVRHIQVENRSDIDVELLSNYHNTSCQIINDIENTTNKYLPFYNNVPVSLYDNNIKIIEIAPMDINNPRNAHVTATPISHNGISASYLIQNNWQPTLVKLRLPIPSGVADGDPAYTPLATAILSVYQNTILSVNDQSDVGMFLLPYLPEQYNIHFDNGPLKWYYMTDRDYHNFSLLVGYLSPGFSKLEIENESFTLDASASSVKTKMLTDIHWAASSNQTWLTMFRNNGLGNDTLIFNAQANTSKVNRTATVTLNSGDNVKTITFSQLAEPGNALNFDGSDDYVTIPDNDANISSAVTIETWVLYAEDGVQFICSKDLEHLEIHTSTGGNIRFIPTNHVYIDATAVLPVNRWTHLACVYDPAQLLAKIYINGVEVPVVNGGSNPLSTPLAANASEFRLGRRVDGIYPFKGSMDEFRIWNVALTQQQIQDNFAQPIIDYATQSNLVSYYNFNQGIAGGDNALITELTDLKGNFNGTLNSFALTGSTSNWVESYAMVVPKATAATNIAENSFTANWEAPVVGYFDNYLMYVSTDSSFSTLLDGYNPKIIGNDVISESISGLLSNTNYYYKLQANKISLTGVGAFSNTILAKTDLILNISASVNPANSGAISGDGNYSIGTTAELIATPETNFDFVNWTESGIEVSIDATYSFTLTENRILIANFVLQTFEISASVNPANSGTISGAGTFDYGTSIELIATPEIGYDFVNWTEDGTPVSIDATYSFTLTENRILIANFVLQTFEISASVNPVNSGTISGAGTFDYGTSIELIATPEIGYDFVNWTEDGTPVSIDATYSFTLTENRILIANFVLQTFEISASVNPVNSGTISGAGTFDYGTSIELIATPEIGYDFVNWTEDGIEVSTDATYSFTLTENRILIANFVLQTFEISASVNPANSGTISGAGTFDYGTSIELIATPEIGYDFVNWTEDGTPVSTDATYSFTLTENRILIANFVNITGVFSFKEANSINVYPNPFLNELIIEMEGNNEIINFDILNALGQVVYKGNLVGKTIVQTNSFAPGVYIVKLANGKTFEFKKIIKE